MTALQRLTAAGLLMFVGRGHCQEPLVRIPAPPANVINRGDIESVNDLMWQHEPPVAGTSEADWQNPEMQKEGAEEVPACNCGKKRCHGVCRDPGHPAKPKREKPGDVDRGDCPPLRYRIADCQRAGNPHCVAKWAKCSVDGKYSAWFAGGGAAFFRGRSRQPSEGTWGLDYNGVFGHANVWLKYTRDRQQGGEGAYETDGEPKFVSRAHSLLELGH